MSVLSEFKAFIARGNVIDLAVAVVIGAAFGKIVDSFVKDVITPPLGLLIGGVDFTNLKVGIGGTDAAPVTLNYGVFLQACFNFLIIAAAIFILVKMVTVMTRKPAPVAAEPPPTPADVLLLTEIRDELRKRN
ncbi:MAG: large-conductance mechanosensitive channel [Fibrobacterota bacterium]|jgi:large conductance mechanosensitive channel